MAAVSVRYMASTGGRGPRMPVGHRNSIRARTNDPVDPPPCSTRSSTRSSDVFSG